MCWDTSVPVLNDNIWATWLRSGRKTWFKLLLCFCVFLCISTSVSVCLCHCLSVKLSAYYRFQVSLSAGQSMCPSGRTLWILSDITRSMISVWPYVNLTPCWSVCLSRLSAYLQLPFCLGLFQVDALRVRLEEKEQFLTKKTKQLQDLTDEKSTLTGEIRDMKDMLDVKERKVNVLQKKVSECRY